MKTYLGNAGWGIWQTLFLQSFLSLKLMQNRFLKLTWAKHAYDQDFPLRSEFGALPPLPSDCVQYSWVPAPVGELNRHRNGEGIYLLKAAFQIIETFLSQSSILECRVFRVNRVTERHWVGNPHRGPELSRLPSHMTTSAFSYQTNTLPSHKPFHVMGWRDGSALKNACFSCRKPEFCS